MEELIAELTCASEQCTECGFRFMADGSDAVERETHRAWHARLNKSRRITQMRPWYLSADNWCFAAGFTAASTGTAAIVPSPRATHTPKTPNFISHTANGVEVPAHATEDATCEICSEELHKTYHARTHMWIYDNTLRAPRLGGAIVHTACDKDYDYYSDEGSPALSSASAPRASMPRLGLDDGSPFAKRFRYG